MKIDRSEMVIDEAWWGTGTPPIGVNLKIHPIVGGLCKPDFIGLDSQIGLTKPSNKRKSNIFFLS